MGETPTKPTLTPVSISLAKTGSQDRVKIRCLNCGERVLFRDRDSAKLVLLSKGVLTVGNSGLEGSCKKCGAGFVAKFIDIGANKLV